MISFTFVSLIMSFVFFLLELFSNNTVIRTCFTNFMMQWMGWRIPSLISVCQTLKRQSDWHEVGRQSIITHPINKHKYGRYMELSLLQLWSQAVLPFLTRKNQRKLLNQQRGIRPAGASKYFFFPGDGDGGKVSLLR